MVDKAVEVFGRLDVLVSDSSTLINGTIKNTVEPFILESDPNHEK